MTKVIEVINNVLSIASNKEISLWVKLLIVLVVIVVFGVISFYKKKGSVTTGAIVVIIAILIVVGGEIRSCGGPGPSTPTPQETATATATPTETPTVMVTETPTATIAKTDTEPTEISIQDANVLDDGEFFSGEGSEQDAYGNVYDSYVEAVIGGVDLSSDGTQSEVYLLQGKYSRFTGKLFVSKDDSSHNTFIMKVYLDGVQKYKSEIIKKDMGPWEFDYDITGANKVKVEFCMVEGVASMETAMTKETRTYLADGMFIK